MAKYFGTIGYGVTREVAPGVWAPDIVEVTITGDIIKISKRSDTTENLNDNITLSNRISFLSDPCTPINFQFIKYATYMDVKWKVTSVEVDFPRLILNLGGVYNE